MIDFDFIALSIIKGFFAFCGICVALAFMIVILWAIADIISGLSAFIRVIFMKNRSVTFNNAYLYYRKPLDKVIGWASTPFFIFMWYLMGSLFQ